MYSKISRFTISNTYKYNCHSQVTTSTLLTPYNNTCRSLEKQFYTSKKLVRCYSVYINQQSKLAKNLTAG